MFGKSRGIIVGGVEPAARDALAGVRGGHQWKTRQHAFASDQQQSLAAIGEPARTQAWQAQQAHPRRDGHVETRRSKAVADEQRELARSELVIWQRDLAATIFEPKP